MHKQALENEGWLKPGSKVPLIERGKLLEVEIVRYLASGQQADTYIATEPSGRTVVLKHLYGPFAENIPLFYKKVAKLTEIESPHPDLVWPEAISILTPEKSFCYTMPYVENHRDLAAVIKRKVPMRNDQKAKLLCKLADVLMCLHAQNLVYGDISHKNLLYQHLPNGDIDLKLIDCENISISGKCFGLQGSFRSPELINGKYQNATCQSDIYAYGVLAFRMLMRCHPLDGARNWEHSFDDRDAFIKDYGEDPCFIFDGSNKNPPMFEAVCQRWNALDKAVRLYFSLAFCQESLKGEVPYPSLDLAKNVFSNFLT